MTGQAFLAASFPPASMRPLLLVLVMLVAVAVSAQDRPPAWGGLGSEIGYVLADGEDPGWDLLGASLQVTRPLGGGPLVVQVGVSGGGDLFGSDGFGEGHVAVGVQGQRGPFLLAAVAGPSLVRATRSEYDDPRYAEGRSRVVPGAYVGMQALVSIIPAAGRGPSVGLGMVGFAHVNDALPVIGFGPTIVVGRLPRAVLPPR